MAFRRPNMMRFTNAMSESLSVLESSPEATSSDKRLIAWVKLQRIMEAASSALGFDDPSAEITLTDPRTQLSLKGFEKQLEDWKRNIDPDVMNGTFLSRYHSGLIPLADMTTYRNSSHKLSFPYLSPARGIPSRIPLPRRF
jgi:hypothetical protein